MIFNYLYALPNATDGIDNIMVQVISAVPAFVPLLLVFVFFVVLLGGSSRQKARTGSADFPMWSVIASLSILMVSLLMSVASGFINVVTLVIVVVITIFSGVWFFLDKKDSAV